MKSLLVDALRRANTDDTGRSVSDSGSFDTADSEFGDTANDAMIDTHESEADELELLKSTGVIVVGDEVTGATIQEAPDFSRFDDAGAQPSIANGNHDADIAQACVPALARYSPLICISFAIVAAGSWLLYQQLESRYFRDVFDTYRLQAAASDDGVESALTTAESNLGRFPFIRVPAVDAAEKESESIPDSVAAGPAQ